MVKPSWSPVKGNPLCSFLFLSLSGRISQAILFWGHSEAKEVNLALPSLLPMRPASGGNGRPRLGDRTLYLPCSQGALQPAQAACGTLA